MYLEGCILPDAEGVGNILGDGLFAVDVLRTLHHCTLAHALERIHAAGGVLCRV